MYKRQAQEGKEVLTITEKGYGKKTPVEEYRITNRGGLGIKNYMVTEKTGGIVQGMSGSPILQDGKLVGAVTHVLIDHADRGYGILAQNMLDQAAQAQNT